MKKTLLAGILVLSMIFSLLFGMTACGESPAETKRTAEATTAESPAETDEETLLTQQTPETEETTPESEKTPTETAEKTEPEASEIPKTETPVTAEPTHSHKYAVVNNTPATCTQKGSVQYRCETCGDTYTKTTDMAAHSYGAWVTVSEASCTKAGQKTRTCSVCGKEEAETVKATGHQAQVVEEHLFGADYSCKLCGERYTLDFSGEHHFKRERAKNGNLLLVCTDCGLQFLDIYADEESRFTSQDRTAALYTDTITIKNNDGGRLAKWPGRWREYSGYISQSAGGLSIGIGVEEYPEFATFDALAADFRTFLKEYSDFYGWTPTIDIDTEYQGIFFEDEVISPEFTAYAKKLSTAKKNAIAAEMAAYWVYDSGVYDGMQLYNAVGVLYDYMRLNILPDYYCGNNTAYEAMTAGRATGKGHAAVFDLLCTYCGIASTQVNGKAGYPDPWSTNFLNVSHTWNKVTFSDGSVRYVDVMLGFVDYLILVPKEMLIDHTL